jgi:pheromone shutdown protein TraB
MQFLIGQSGVPTRGFQRRRVASSNLNEIDTRLRRLDGGGFESRGRPGKRLTHSSAGWSQQYEASPHFVDDCNFAPGTMSYLRSSSADILLVGTAHVSRESARQVSRMIDDFKPSVVLLELCPKRWEQLKAGKEVSDAEFLAQSLRSFFEPGTSLSHKILKFGFSGMYRIFKHIGLNPGEEFKAALDAAERHGSRVVLADRDVKETLRRISENLRVEDIWRLILPGDESGVGQGLPIQMPVSNDDWSKEIERMKTRESVRAMVARLRKINPGLVSSLIDERDEILCHNLAKQKGQIAGVVGLAHLDGIEKLWSRKPGCIVRRL